MRPGFESPSDINRAPPAKAPSRRHRAASRRSVRVADQCDGDAVLVKQ
jgi:hypothetical protein